MLEPITRRVTDESDSRGFLFTFYCDICDSPWSSIRYCGSGDTSERESERIAAYERSNREAMMHFNRCPVCKRMVCDKCFVILDERDVCKECMHAQRK